MDVRRERASSVLSEPRRWRRRRSSSSFLVMYPEEIDSRNTFIREELCEETGKYTSIYAENQGIRLDSPSVFAYF
jgi:hypothetical protein